MGRVELVEGAVDASGGALEIRLEAETPGEEEALRVAFSRALAKASDAGAPRVVVAPDAATLGFPAQRCAEILIEAARAAAAQGDLEIVFALSGEPTYRLYEAVYDSARIAEQMRRLRG